MWRQPAAVLDSEGFILPCMSSLCMHELEPAHDAITRRYIPALTSASAVPLHRLHQAEERLWRSMPHSLPARKQHPGGRACLEALAQPRPQPPLRQGLH